jgi:hypothetical protein
MNYIPRDIAIVGHHRTMISALPQVAKGHLISTEGRVSLCGKDNLYIHPRSSWESRHGQICKHCLKLAIE